MDLRAVFKKKEKPPVCSAVVVAAGSSQRMGSDKLMAKLGPIPVLVRTLLAFQDSPLVDEIIVVTRMEKIEEVADLCHNCGLAKVKKVISGGATRMESALAGVSEVRSGARLIAIHDGARPLVTQDLISRVVYDAREHMSSIPVIPSTDTLKLVDDNGKVTGTVDRSRTVRVQTPQVFDADLIKGALTKAAKDALPITDDCSAMDIMGITTHTVMGDTDNIKITTPNDMVTAEAIIKNRGDWNANRAWV